MTKIARPAFSEATKFMKKEWKGVMLLALKTFLLIMLFELLAAIPGIVMGVSEFFLTENKDTTALGGYSIIDIFTSIIAFFLTQWVVSPLYVATSRSVVLGEPFDRVLCKRLTEARTVRVMKLLWSLFILLIPFYVVATVLVLNPQLVMDFATLRLELIAAIVIAFLAYLVFIVYFSLKIYYLVPALATDYPFTSVSDLWKQSKGHTWSILKVLLLGFLLFFGVGLLCIAGIALFVWLFGIIAKLIIAGKLVLQILIGIVAFLIGIFMLAVLVLLIPQYVMAAVAGVYKLSQAKGDKA